MCGIIGYIGSKEAVPILLDGLKKLEYRGYDSAGIAVLKDNKIKIVKCKGKVAKLENLLEKDAPKGNIGLGHTRWATHGRPNNINAHPHNGCNSEIVVVHNGIIENYMSLRERLISEGHNFISETDTEVLPHLIESNYQNDFTLAVKKSIKEIEGSYAIGIISTRDPGKVVASRCGSPLIIGIGEGEMFLASDIPALLSYTNRVIFLEEKEIATITKDGVEIINSEGNILPKEVVNIDWDEEMTEKSGYKHFMLKEIFQDTMVIRNNLEGRINLSTKTLELNNLSLPLDKIKEIERISILACGSSNYTALAGKYIFEELTGISVMVDYSSEFRYRKILLGKKDLVILISQSGETADTIAVLRACREAGSYILALTNVRGSTISREADSVMYIKAGPEIGVATTKAFVGQLMCLYILSLYFAQVRKTLDSLEINKIISELIKIPQMVEIILLKDPEIVNIVDRVFYIPKTSDILYPILSVIPLQLFAYHIANKLGCDVDKPRNLAKSVTVE